MVRGVGGRGLKVGGLGSPERRRRDANDSGLRWGPSRGIDRVVGGG